MSPHKVSPVYILALSIQRTGRERMLHARQGIRQPQENLVLATPR
jgi:hypothetical protein